MSAPPGPALYEYLKAFQGDAVSQGAFEAPLYTDCAIVGEIRIGPFLFLNPVTAKQAPGYFQPAIVFRAESVAIELRMSLDKTDVSRYHGGTLLDEIAALLSLCLAMRVQAGAVDREFYSDHDRGHPRAWQLRPWPESRAVGDRPRLPWTSGSRELSVSALARIGELPRLSPKEANALIKAARMYQQALWIGEWEPERSWLLFVSAIEALMNFGSGRTQQTDAELLTTYSPTIAAKIVEEGGVTLLEALAPYLRMLVGSARKFCEFVNAYVPGPPDLRPPPPFQIPWTPANLQLAMRTIYNHRSRALHDGVPFPAPMAESPSYQPEWSAPSEQPFGLAASALQGAWLIEDMPMYIHIFEHIVRHSILAWWSSRADTAANPTASDSSR